MEINTSGSGFDNCSGAGTFSGFNEVSIGRFSWLGDSTKSGCFSRAERKKRKFLFLMQQLI